MMESTQQGLPQLELFKSLLSGTEPATRSLQELESYFQQLAQALPTTPKVKQYAEQTLAELEILHKEIKAACKLIVEGTQPKTQRILSNNIELTKQIATITKTQSSYVIKKKYSVNSLELAQLDVILVACRLSLLSESVHLLQLSSNVALFSESAEIVLNSLQNILESKDFLKSVRCAHFGSIITRRDAARVFARVLRKSFRILLRGQLLLQNDFDQLEFFVLRNLLPSSSNAFARSLLADLSTSFVYDLARHTHSDYQLYLAIQIFLSNNSNNNDNQQSSNDLLLAELRGQCTAYVFVAAQHDAATQLQILEAVLHHNAQGEEVRTAFFKVFRQAILLESVQQNSNEKTGLWQPLCQEIQFVTSQEVCVALQTYIVQAIDYLRAEGHSSSNSNQKKTLQIVKQIRHAYAEGTLYENENATTLREVLENMLVDFQSVQPVPASTRELALEVFDTLYALHLRDAYANSKMVDTTKIVAYLKYLCEQLDVANDLSSLRVFFKFARVAQHQELLDDELRMAVEQACTQLLKPAFELSIKQRGAYTCKYLALKSIEVWAESPYVQEIDFMLADPDLLEAFMAFIQKNFTCRADPIAQVAEAERASATTQQTLQLSSHGDLVRNFSTHGKLLQALGIIRNEATRNPAIVRAYLEEIIEEC